MTEIETMGARLMHCRVTQGWTQEEVVALCHDDRGRPLLDVRTLRRWEKDQAAPRPGPRLRALARLYHVSVGWLLKGDTDE